MSTATTSPARSTRIEDGVDATVDLAEVNGRVFVNNASMGVYAEIVQSTDYRDAKLQTAAAMLPELLGPESTPLDLRFTLPSGEEATTAQLLLVSTTRTSLRACAAEAPASVLDRGVLGIAFCTSRHPASQRARRARSRRPRPALRQLE